RVLFRSEPLAALFLQNHDPVLREQAHPNAVNCHLNHGSPSPGDRYPLPACSIRALQCASAFLLPALPALCLRMGRLYHSPTCGQSVFPSILGETIGRNAITAEKM